MHAHRIFFVHASIHGRLFPYLGYCENSPVNLGVQFSLWDSDFIYFGWIPGSGITGWYASSHFNFWGNLHSVVHCGYTNLHSHWEYTELRENFSWALGKSGCWSWKSGGFVISQTWVLVLIPLMCDPWAPGSTICKMGVVMLLCKTVRRQTGLYASACGMVCANQQL